MGPIGSIFSLPLGFTAVEKKKEKERETELSVQTVVTLHADKNSRLYLQAEASLAREQSSSWLQLCSLVEEGASWRVCCRECVCGLRAVQSTTELLNMERQNKRGTGEKKHPSVGSGCEGHTHTHTRFFVEV